MLQLTVGKDTLVWQTPSGVTLPAWPGQEDMVMTFEELYSDVSKIEMSGAKPIMATVDEARLFGDCVRLVRENHDDFVVSELERQGGKVTSFCYRQVNTNARTERAPLVEMLDLLGLTFRDLPKLKENYKPFHKRIEEAIKKNNLKRKASVPYHR